MNAAVAKAVEPTMEEILASIRRIIADDQKPGPGVLDRPAAPSPASLPSAPPPKPRLVEPAQEPPPLVVEAIAVEISEPEPAASAPVPQAPGPFPPPAEDAPELPVEALPSILTARAPDAPAEEPEAVHEREPLLSTAADEAVSHSFGALAHAHVAHNLPPLENIIREMLRPMLKTWLDDNLPGIVEKLVRVEIERVARGGRG